jgi:hypothetical protein
VFFFLIFLPVLLFLLLKSRENKGKTADGTGSEKPENKKQKYRDC